MCDRVMVNVMERIIACRASRDGYMPDIVFQCLTLTSPEENDIFVMFFLKVINLIYSSFKSCALFETPFTTNQI
jgi:hypothetical protein